MKLIGRLLTFLLLFVVCFCGTVLAQDSTSVIRVTIPFEFRVGEKSFPAGDYTLVQPMQHFVVLRDARGQTVTSAFTNEINVVGRVTNPKLRFATIDGQYVLTELWQAQEPSGQRLVSAKPHISIARRHSEEAREAAEGSQP